MLNDARPVANPLPEPVVRVLSHLKAATGIHSVLCVQCANFPWPAKASSPMAKISFVQTVPKTSSCPLEQQALHHNQILGCDARVRAVTLLHVRCSCRNACGKDLITDGKDIICSDCAKDKLMSTSTASFASQSDFRLRRVALPYEQCACGKDFITDGEDIICPDCAKDKLMHVHCNIELCIIIRCLAATHVCVRSHFQTCDVRAAKTSSTMAKSFFQTVPKTSSCSKTVSSTS